MYPSSTCDQDTNFFLFSDNITANSILTDHEGFSSSSMFNYFPPSPIINYDDAPVFYQHLHEIMHQNVTHETSSNNMIKITEGSINSSADKKESSCVEGAVEHSKEIRVNRKCKKDRHSKIITADGSFRGRRMRLSIDVAKPFFALQDSLGFDKPSKTVEWLIMRSEDAIKEVKKNWVSRTKGSSSPSSPLVLSAVDELEAQVAKKKKMIGEKGSRKLAALHHLTKGSREKARARARERTQEKKRRHVGGFIDEDQYKLYNISQESDFGWNYNPSSSCIKSARFSNNILHMNPRDPAPVLENSPNCSKRKS